MLTVKNLTVARDGTALLRDISFTIKAGEVYALTGLNGAGKSTLAGALMGLEGYSVVDGEIILDNVAITSASMETRVQKGLTMMWQESARFEGLSVREYLTVAAKNDNTAAFKEALSVVGLDYEAYIDRMLDNALSGGERKRIELAAILLQKPKAVILDEPDSGLDVDALPQLQNYLQHLADNNTAVVVISHIDATLSGITQRLQLQKGVLV